jgi:CheY-like chemotaxis protein
MGGEIGVESMLKAGSTFRFTARLGHVETGGTQAPIPERDGPALDGTALLVGGPAPVRAALRDQLAAWGMRVEEAADAAGALDALREGVARGGGYDVALVDEQLPDMSAVELARQLRGAPATPPLLLLTARERAAGDALPAGIAAWLATPVRPAQLYGAVAQLVGRAAPVKEVGTQDRLSTVAPTQADARGGRILVAEDNSVNQLVTVHLVAALG